MNIYNSEEKFPATSLCMCILGTRMKPGEGLNAFSSQTGSIIMALTQKNTVYTKYHHVLGVRCTSVSRTGGETAQRRHTNFTLTQLEPQRSEKFSYRAKAGMWSDLNHWKEITEKYLFWVASSGLNSQHGSQNAKDKVSSS